MANPDIVPMPSGITNQADILQATQSKTGLVQQTLASAPPEILNAMKSGLLVTGLAMGYWWTIKTIVTGKNQFFKGI